MDRYALHFTVKPGAEEEVAHLLKTYDRPPPEIDDETKLLGTTIFMHGNHVIRVMDVQGDLRKVIQHLAAQPGIHELEEKLTPLLEEPRDMSTPEGARGFFMKAMMTRVTHRVAGEPDA